MLWVLSFCSTKNRIRGCWCLGGNLMNCPKPPTLKQSKRTRTRGRRRKLIEKAVSNTENYPSQILMQKIVENCSSLLDKRSPPKIQFSLSFFSLAELRSKVKLFGRKKKENFVFPLIYRAICFCAINEPVWLARSPPPLPNRRELLFEEEVLHNNIYPELFHGSVHKIGDNNKQKRLSYPRIVPFWLPPRMRLRRISSGTFQMIPLLRIGWLARG